MQGQLARRFVLGDNDISAESFGDRLKYEMTVGSVRRERQLVDLARGTLAAQLETARVLGESSLKVEREVREGLEGLVASLTGGFESLSDDLYELQQTLGIELTEIRWELAEQTSILSQILDALRNKRKAEAQELISDGRRLFEKGYFDDSVERFNLALELTKSDFEAYFRLGLAHIQLDDASSALEAFDRAVAFAPEDVPVARAEALAGRARTLFCIGEFAEAAESMALILPLQGAIPDSLCQAARYRLAVYQARSGKTREAMDEFEALVRSAPEFLGRGLADQDWGGSVRAEMVALAERLITELAAATVYRLSELEVAVTNSRLSSDLLEALCGCVSQLRSEVCTASYKRLAGINDRCGRVEELIDMGGEILAQTQSANRLADELQARFVSGELMRSNEETLGPQSLAQRESRKQAVIGAGAALGILFIAAVSTDRGMLGLFLALALIFLVGPGILAWSLADAGNKRRQAMGAVQARVRYDAAVETIEAERRRVATLRSQFFEAVKAVLSDS